MNIVRSLALLAACLCAATGAGAQDYPSKPVRVVVPFTPGSATDVLGRTVCLKLSELLGQQVVVENRPGAGGSIGAASVAKSAPDGYTLLFHSSAFAANSALYTNLPYDALKDFIGISPVVSQPFVLVVGADAGPKTIRDLIDAARAKPGQVNYGSSGTGSGTHLSAEKFRLAAKFDAVHIPYKGGPEATADVIAGRVTYWFPPIAIALPQIRDGRLLALGVTTARRSSQLPEVPTIAEAGVPSFESAVWWGLWAPAGTPSGVVEKLARDVARALAAPDLRERLAKLGAEPMTMTPAEFASFVGSEIDDAARIVKAAGIKVQ
jgi:tripartite-type tricarboxylate transporter receptor subunit TctC